ncbi:PDR/VanB family oxidoreductase [Aquincola tertiaricarbonis]|uniref:PDR/VanB family oxidoreductase n=1 Tax=Aquincola tertiaricarbonis TaxID=391953 RepID=A0ABY4S8N1_AQUTE|nr:PDR/VanB family oxidoreductase [Aquincola tertiaricarbonis]URI08247.1 PDR/VanB family oxidoreductase [Aquincola tertiaricarbonis]
MNTQALQVVVRRRMEQGGNIVLLDLADAAGAALPAFQAGAHVDVHLPTGLVRQYSLCSDPADVRRYRLGVLRDPSSRGGSIAVHEHLTEGASVTISAPRNHFPLAAEAAYSVLVGGGIGITPMIAMAYELSAAGRPFELHYCARSAGACAFLDELAAAPFADRVHVHFDDAGDAQRLNLPASLSAAPAGTHVYVCGPTGFMDWVIGTAAAQGLAQSQIHREYFSADVDTSGQGFEVVAAASGRSVQVREGQTILQALSTIGIEVPVSCEEGVCGTCVCTVLEGQCDHRDVYLTDEERAANDQILVCCSRAKSARLVLDL